VLVLQWGEERACIRTRKPFRASSIDLHVHFSRTGRTHRDKNVRRRGRSRAEGGEREKIGLYSF
jgi:hypothetical protein